MKRFIGAAIFLASVSLLSVNTAKAQYRSEFEELKGKEDNEVIYQGLLTFDDLQNIPAFNFDKASESYTPKPDAINGLTASLKNYDILVFLGTWCEDSQRMLPHLSRVLEDAEYPLEQLTLQAVDHQKIAKNNAEKPYDIKLVPTVILLQNGKEVGRITEIPDKSIEEDLWTIINK